MLCELTAALNRTRLRLRACPTWSPDLPSARHAGTGMHGHRPPKIGLGVCDFGVTTLPEMRRSTSCLIGMASERMKSRLILICGFFMVPVCLLGLFYQSSFLWVVCPQGLVVMFYRQSLHAYDSLGAASYPDLAVAALYYPVVGWILSRASRQERLGCVAARVVIWHIAALGFALGAAEIRNWIWRAGF